MSAYRPRRQGFRPRPTPSATRLTASEARAAMQPDPDPRDLMRKAAEYRKRGRKAAADLLEERARLIRKEQMIEERRDG